MRLQRICAEARLDRCIISYNVANIFALTVGCTEPRLLWRKGLRTIMHRTNQTPYSDAVMDTCCDLIWFAKQWVKIDNKKRETYTSCRLHLGEPSCSDHKHEPTSPAPFQSCGSYALSGRHLDDAFDYHGVGRAMFHGVWIYRARQHDERKHRAQVRLQVYDWGEMHSEVQIPQGQGCRHEQYPLQKH